MSSAVLAAPLCPVQTRSPLAIDWTTVLAGLFVAAMFYVADQDWHFSQLDLNEEAMESATTEGNPLRRTGLLMLGVAGAALLVRRGGESLRVGGALGWLCVAFAAWSMASLWWAADQGVVFRRLLADGCLIAAALAAARWVTPRQLAWIALISTGCFFLVGVAAELSLGLFHPGDPEWRFSGTMHPNDQGMHRAVMCLAALYLARPSDRGASSPVVRWLLACRGGGQLRVSPADEVPHVARGGPGGHRRDATGDGFAAGAGRLAPGDDLRRLVGRAPDRRTAWPNRSARRCSWAARIPRPPRSPAASRCGRNSGSTPRIAR